MKRGNKLPRRPRSAFGVAFLDIISCGFGAMVLLVLISRQGFDTDPTEPRSATLLQRTFALEEEITQLDELLRKERLRLADNRGSNATARLAAQRLETEAERASREAEERRALFNLSEGEAEVRDEEVGGIPVDSDYVVFVIDTSGSMRQIWPRVLAQITAILNIHPQVKGFQIINDNGAHLLRDRAGRWLPDTPQYRRLAMNALNRWQSTSNSSPVEGIEAALARYARFGTLSIYVFGDAYTGGSYDADVDRISRRNRDTNGDLLARIHGIGFLTDRPDRFATLMREVTRQNNGTFLALYR